MDDKLNMRVKGTSRTEASAIMSWFRGAAGNLSGLLFQEIHLPENTTVWLGAHSLSDHKQKK